VRQYFVRGIKHAMFLFSLKGNDTSFLMYRSPPPTDVPPSAFRALSCVCVCREVLGDLSSAGDEKDGSTVPGAGIYKNDVLFQM